MYYTYMYIFKNRRQFFDYKYFTLTVFHLAP